jgi:hypothetical protein
LSRITGRLLYLRLAGQLYKVSLFFNIVATKNSGWNRTNGARLIPSILALNLEGASVYH